MALTHSTMLELGTTVPDFQLPDVVSGKMISPGQFAGQQGLLVMFICRHCPYVVHVQQELGRLGKDYVGKPLGMLAISSNDAENYPDDHPERLRAMARELEFPFPYCYDESQAVAKVFTAACTPDFFLFDETRKLVYRGQLDDSRPREWEAGDGKRFAGSDRCRPGGAARESGSTPQCRVQHQVEVLKGYT